MKRTYHILLWGVVLGLFGLALVVGPAAADDAEHLQSWSQRIDGDDRFEVLEDFNDEAVLDKETQLVWERSPRDAEGEWLEAINACLDTILGGRKGWRLPTAWEVMSLIDPFESIPALPAGHPFIGLGDTEVWTAERAPADTASVQTVDLSDGGRDNATLVGNPLRFWCVRGGNGGPSYSF